MIKPTAIDCFCGAGGLSLGFKEAGFETVYAFDSDNSCIETYHHNIGKHAYICNAADVSKTSIEKQIGRDLNEIDVVIGGPPCQGFSVQRRGENFDNRNNLVLDFVRLVLEIQPRFFLMENVGGLLSHRGRPILEQLKHRCWEAGYTLIPKKLNAYEFGIAQNRKRVFIVGEHTVDLLARFAFPEENRAVSNRSMTVRDAIQDLMGENENDVPNHVAGRLSHINLERIRAIKAGEGRESLPQHLQLNCHIKNPGHRHLDVYGRMAWDSPSPTITTKFDNFSRGRFGHPELDRTITLREGARLQGFPDSFTFFGNKGQIAAQIGNAVPPPLAKAIAERIRLCL